MGPGDMLRVPRGTTHWFTLCEDRRIRAIRWFQETAGWTPHYTDSGVDKSYQPLCFGPAYLGPRRHDRRSPHDRMSTRVYLLDVEGTVAPLSLVTEELFPYARKHLADFLKQNLRHPRCKRILRLLAEENRAELSEDCPHLWGRDPK